MTAGSHSTSQTSARLSRPETRHWTLLGTIRGALRDLGAQPLRLFVALGVVPNLLYYGCARIVAATGQGQLQGLDIVHPSWPGRLILALGWALGFTGVFRCAIEVVRGGRAQISRVFAVERSFFPAYLVLISADLIEAVPAWQRPPELFAAPRWAQLAVTGWLLLRIYLRCRLILWVPNLIENRAPLGAAFVQSFRETGGNVRRILGVLLLFWLPFGAAVPLLSRWPIALGLFRALVWALASLSFCRLYAALTDRNEPDPTLG